MQKSTILYILLGFIYLRLVIHFIKNRKRTKNCIRIIKVCPKQYVLKQCTFIIILFCLYKISFRFCKPLLCTIFCHNHRDCIFSRNAFPKLSIFSSILCIVNQSIINILL